MSAEWLQDDKSNKDELLERAMEEYGRAVLYMAYSYVKDHGLAEDIAQEAFVKCYSKMDSFRGESSLKTWLMRITINQCKDHLKRWDTRKILFTNKVSEILQEHGNPESKTIHGEKRSELHSKLLKLPVKYREVLFLHYYQELKVNEVAEVLELNPSTVKTRLKTGRERLHRMYGEGRRSDG
ncbi:sigma-70 family RNA polymerase sigma factor [Rossellomorea aquimaris]|uniref:sigma-70 family RNA polymerase sigma factor n=1 Tax=Rossellomorea aquimaris TaxID=189382 RepID=UPI001CD58825|nr:sigma-70 family RNA polymerase sigma factor [Rossellomorea aquimaris]MCA1055928.1 sigma-70 family RNA polymerase sigma factor [Rossellomorea aquimaris]